VDDFRGATDGAGEVGVRAAWLVAGVAVTAPEGLIIDMGEIRRTLKASRLQLGWTQRKLAHRSGVSQEAITKIENGVGSPYLKTIILLAEALGHAVGMTERETT
jgi:DNA-binding XRE family transcriptional regulator